MEEAWASMSIHSELKSQQKGEEGRVRSRAEWESGFILGRQVWELGQDQQSEVWAGKSLGIRENGLEVGKSSASFHLKGIIKNTNRFPTSGKDMHSGAAGWEWGEHETVQWGAAVPRAQIRVPENLCTGKGRAHHSELTASTWGSLVCFLMQTLTFNFVEKTKSGVYRDSNRHAPARRIWQLGVLRCWLD